MIKAKPPARGHNSKVKAGPVSARLMSFISRIEALEARGKALNDEIRTIQAQIYGPENCVKTYFIQAGEGGLVKIGRARDVTARMRSLQTGSATRLKLLRVLYADHERDLHARFAPLRRHGEWFEFSPAMLTAHQAAAVLQ